MYLKKLFQKWIIRSKQTFNDQRYKSAESLAKILSEALPYIQKFSGKIVVIKYGGSAMKENKLRQNFAEMLL